MKQRESFFPTPFKWKNIFSSSSSARSSATCKELNSCTKKENSGNKSYTFGFFFPSLCLLTAILMVGVLSQLRGLRSRTGLYGPSTAFLLHPFHCTLHLCRWQTPAVGFVWAGGFQRCLRCLTSSFSRQLSVPETLFPSLVANTLKLLSWGMGREGSVGQICPPSPLAWVWEDRKFPELFRAGEWAVAGMSMKVLGQSVPHRALSPVRRPSPMGSGVGKWSLHSPVWTDQPSSLACLSETQGWPLRLQLVQYLCSWSGKWHGFYSLLGGWVPLSCPSPVAPESSVAA